MNKQAISVTLTAENLLWLRGQARTAGVKSVSEVLDKVVARARAGPGLHQEGIRSVKGTIGIAAADPELTQADAAVRSLFLLGAPAKVSPRRVGAGHSRARRRVARSKS
jgi:hypothetical protein